jgi:hypothetical protein
MEGHTAKGKGWTMLRMDFNRCLVMVALVVMVLIAAASGYRLEIGQAGFKFEPNVVRANDLYVKT